MKADTLEFFEADSQRPFLIVDSSLRPSEGELVNIRGETWKIVGVSFAVDYADEINERKMRCNVIVAPNEPDSARPSDA